MTARGGAFRGTKVVVTGGLGFIGSNLVLSLLRQGASVTVIDPCVSGCGGELKNLGNHIRGVEWLAHDIGQTDELQTAIRSANVIFNLAGEIRHQHSMIDPERDMELNTRSQLRFLMACARWNPGVRVVFAGTRQVYGVPRYLPVDEGHPIEPVDFNGVHKHAAASYHLLLSRQGLIDGCVLHLSNVYGPRMALDISGQGFLGAFVRCLRDGVALTVYGHGRQTRDPLYVDDAVEAFLTVAMAIELPSRLYNVGGPATLRLLDIALQASLAAGAEEPRLRPFPNEQQQIDIGDYCSNNTRIREELGWTAQTFFEDGIRRTLNSYGVVTRTAEECVTAR